MVNCGGESAGHMRGLCNWKFKDKIDREENKHLTYTLS